MLSVHVVAAGCGADQQGQKNTSIDDTLRKRTPPYVYAGHTFRGCSVQRRYQALHAQLA